jgi:hypothetical protein
VLLVGLGLAGLGLAGRTVLGYGDTGGAVSVAAGPPAAPGPAARGAASGTRATPTRSTPTRSTPTKPAATRSARPKTARPGPIRLPQNGSGVLVTVPGSVRAPGGGKVVRVQVEEGLGKAIRQEPSDFADAVLSTLNDDRSWGHGGSLTFARTDGAAEVTVVLATAGTSAGLCRPLVTFGRLSCAVGPRAVLTAVRWVEGTPEFPDLAVYRRYLVNHEVGHVLGRRHETCPGAGRLAPVMQQQTKQVAPCRPNAWPYP